jgi:hypothetical protein
MLHSQQRLSLHWLSKKIRGEHPLENVRPTWYIDECTKHVGLTFSIKEENMVTTIEKDQTVKFRYTKISGEEKTVDHLVVDRVFSSSEGYEIVQGYLDDGEGRSYRKENMKDIEVVDQ